MPKFSNIAAYKFAPLSDLKSLRTRILDLCKEWELKGSILLSDEGINLFVAGAPDKVELLIVELKKIPGLAELPVKISESDHQPFSRMLVRIKREIISFGVEGIAPGQRTSPKLKASVLKQWLDEGRPVTLLDTRNDYEVKLGTFKNALPMGIDHFRQFPAAVRKLPAEMKEQPIVMFCTGGIRCEKAGPFMEREGFKNIFQLDGGILKYFEECGGAHYTGECFVFDQRVGVDPTLHETDSALCFNCQMPLSKEELQDKRYVPNISCPYCFKTAGEQMAANISRRHEALRRVVNPLPGSQPYDKVRPVSIPNDCDGWSLADALCRIIVHVPRAYWEEECAKGLLLNQKNEAVTALHRVRAKERYQHKFLKVVEPDVNGNIEILHEDEALIVLNKPAPLPMHAGGRFNRNTLQHILNQIYYPEKPKPAHRLDANTTGIVLLTRTRRFAARLQPQFEHGQVEKIYLVRIQGSPAEDNFICDAPISGEAGEVGTRQIDLESGLKARTEFRVLRRNSDGTTLLEARPLTGRTNQIRIHLWHLGFSVCGDALYLPDHKLGTTQTLGTSDVPLCLHAWKIAFMHPLDRKPMKFCAPVPEWAGDVSELIDQRT